ncbi:MAG: hypothetical protein JWM44_1300 [Bacilli bacterium]|nr:hypothetical protein [Bacilli bacterium]
MIKTDIAKVFITAVDQIISDRFDEHLKQSDPQRTTDDDRETLLGLQLASTLDEKQMALFLEYEELLHDIRTGDNLRYFRLGFKDGVIAGRTLI